MFDYLKKYDKSVNIIDVKDVDVSVIPKYWLSVLNEEIKEDRVKKVIGYWKLNFSLELSNTINFLESNLQDVILLESKGKYSLLYCIKNLADKIIYYQGFNPLDIDRNNKALHLMESSFNQLKRFYSEVHDGFFHFSSHAMGLVPVNEIVYFNEYEWGILDELEKPIQIKLDSTYGLFSSGAGGYVAIDFSSNKSNVWFTNDIPEYNVNFWDVVDEWIVMGLED